MSPDNTVTAASQILAREIGAKEERMSLWVDKHRPTSLSKLDYHRDQAKWLIRLVSVVKVLTRYVFLHYCRCKVETCHICWCMVPLEQERKLASCAS